MTEDEFRAAFLHQFRERIEFPRAERRARIEAELKLAETERGTLDRTRQSGVASGWRASLGRSLIALGRSLAASEE